MKLSTKARYGLRAMLDLAERRLDAPVQARLIAERQGISPKYLEHLLASLKAAGLVTVVRGAHGGYELARDPDAITLGQVVRALEGPLSIVDCTEDSSSCPRMATCAAHDVWQRLKAAVESVLDNATLADLIEMHAQKCGEPGRVMYHI